MTFVVKRIFVLFLFLFSMETPASLLACLGREELALHRNRESGAVYHLNQFFVNQLAKDKNSLHLSLRHKKRICGEKVASPSIALLKHLLLNGDRVFVYPAAAASLEKDAYKAFFIFLLKIQASAPSGKCLEKHVPHYSYFMDRRKHLEDEEEPLLKEKKKIIAIFKKIERPKALLSKCRKNP